MLKSLLIALVLALFLAAGWLISPLGPTAESSAEVESPEAQDKPIAQETLSKEPVKTPPKVRPADTKDLENLEKELLGEMKKLNQRLDGQINGIKLDIDRLKRNVRRDYRNLQNLPEESLGLKDELSEVKRSLRKAQGEIRSLQRENNRLKRDVEALQRELRHLKRKIG